MGLKELREKLALIKTEVRGLIGTDVAAAEIKMTISIHSPLKDAT